MHGTLDKLPDIRAYLVRLDDKWQQWNYPGPNLWSSFVSGVTVTLKKPVVEVDLIQRKIKPFKHLLHLNLVCIVMPKITNQLSAKRLVM